MSVVEGDQETLFDAERIRATGARVIQVNTGAGCHLDARHGGDRAAQARPGLRSVVFVENVGNLVCPALFDLGEHSRVVVTSVTEGADKPVKYPHMFRTADVVLLNKVDLLPYVDFDVGPVRRGGRPGPPAAPRSSRCPRPAATASTSWYGWLRTRHGRVRRCRP